MLAHGFKHILNRHVFAVHRTRQDGSAIDKNRWHIEPYHSHHHTWQGFVATGKTHQRVIAMPAHGQLNGIGNRLAAGQGGAHPLMTHSNAIRHGDCGKLPRGSGGMFHTNLSGLSLAVERNITRSCLVPTGGDAHKRLCDFFGGHAHRIIKGTVRRTRGTDRHMSAGQIGFVEGRLIHCRTLYI